jgi:hypothetical protein
MDRFRGRWEGEGLWARCQSNESVDIGREIGDVTTFLWRRI